MKQALKQRRQLVQMHGNNRVKSTSHYSEVTRLIVVTSVMCFDSFTHPAHTQIIWITHYLMQLSPLVTTDPPTHDPLIGRCEQVVISSKFQHLVSLLAAVSPYHNHPTIGQGYQKRAWQKNTHL